MQKDVVQRRYFNCQFITSNLEFFLLSMEGDKYHQKQLLKHCRVCGKVAKGYAHSVKKEHKNLLAVVGINTSQDSKEVHPNVFCNSCYLTLRQMQAAELSGNVRQTALCPFQWVPHQEGCTVCSHFASSERGGRPRKHRNPCGRPKDGKRALHHYILTISPPSYMVNSKLEISRFSQPASVSLTDFQCKLCQHIVDQPIETTYHHHLMCATCVRDCIDNDNWSCPCGDPSHKLSPESLQKPSEVVLKLQATLLVKCERCNAKMELQHLRTHVLSECQNTQPPSPSKVTVRQLWEGASTSSPTPMEIQTVGILAQRVAPTTGSVVWCATKGQVRYTNNS